MANFHASIQAAIDIYSSTGSPLDSLASTGFTTIYSVAIDNNSGTDLGKVVVAGVSGGDFAVARYTASGALDTTFNSTGKYVTSISATSASVGVAIQSDDKIVVAGSTLTGISQKFEVIRFTEAGALDTTFNSTGSNSLSYGHGANGYDVIILPGGNILVGGIVKDTGGSKCLGTGEFNSDGTVDTSYGDASGVSDLGGIISMASSSIGFAMQLNGDAILVGVEYDFDGRGVWTGSEISSTGSGYGTFSCYTDIANAPSAAIAPDGKIVIAGTSSGHMIVQRYLTNGTLDPTFGTDGTIEEGSGTSGAGVVVRPTGQIIVVGSSIWQFTADSTQDYRTYDEQDANWNTTSITDSSGNVLERYVYSPYGAVTVLNTNWTPKEVDHSEFGMKFLFQGGELDWATGLYKFDARDYDPNTQRWFEQDPAGYVDGANIYQADGSNPLERVDWMGLADIPLAVPNLTTDLNEISTAAGGFLHYLYGDGEDAHLDSTSLEEFKSGFWSSLLNDETGNVEGTNQQMGVKGDVEARARSGETSISYEQDYTIYVHDVTYCPDFWCLLGNRVQIRVKVSAEAKKKSDGTIDVTNIKVHAIMSKRYTFSKPGNGEFLQLGVVLSGNNAKDYNIVNKWDDTIPDFNFCPGKTIETPVKFPFVQFPSPFDSPRPDSNTEVVGSPRATDDSLLLPEDR